MAGVRRTRRRWRRRWGGRWCARARRCSEGKLSGELRWYLESFLDYPFPPQTTRAEAVEASLEAWGAQAFAALFGAGTGRDFYSDAARSGLEQLHLQIISNDASVLAWPWEALRDPQVGPLATACRIERRLDGIRAVDLPAELPKDHIHILLVTARPYQGDVEYRSLSRPLVDLKKGGFPHGSRCCGPRPSMPCVSTCAGATVTSCTSMGTGRMAIARVPSRFRGIGCVRTRGG
jgi:hypothetical protein